MIDDLAVLVLRTEQDDIGIRTELADGRTVVLKPGQSYQVADGTLAHRSRTEKGAKLLIVD